VSEVDPRSRWQGSLAANTPSRQKTVRFAVAPRAYPDRVHALGQARHSSVRPGVAPNKLMGLRSVRAHCIPFSLCNIGIVARLAGLNGLSFSHGFGRPPMTSAALHDFGGLHYFPPDGIWPFRFAKLRFLRYRPSPPAAEYPVGDWAAVASLCPAQP